MNKFFFWLMNPPTDGPKSMLVLRLMAGGVFFWEGVLKFVYVNQGVGRFTKLGIPFPAFTASFRRIPRDLRRPAVAGRPDDKADCDPVCRRDDRSDTFNEDLVVSGNVAVAVAAGTSSGWILGRTARSPIRVRADAHGYFSADQRTGKVVAGCGASA